MNKTEEIIVETQREAIINRPYNLAGSIKRVKKDRFNITQDKVQFGTSNTVPALLKLFMESLDNPIDVAIKGGCDTIEISVDSKSIRVKDNGYGVDTKNNGDILFRAFCQYNTSSNYKEKKGQGQKGVNGIGVKLVTTLSSLFEVISEDTNARIKIVGTENNLRHKTTKLKQTKKTGVDLYYEPDFSIFEVDEIDQEHIDKMYEYTLMQALTYPEIKFKFNKKIVRIEPKKFIKLLSEDSVVQEEKDFFIGIAPSPSGEFKQLSYINGLEISKGGSHIDYIMDSVVKTLRTKISKKYKNIKPSDIRNKLNIVIVGKNMKHIDWEGQVKDTIASTPANIKDYFSDLDLDKFSERVYKNKTITDSIIDYFRIAEEFKKNQELKGLDKPKKRIKSDKYTKPVGKADVLLVCEGLCLEENTELLDENFNPKKIKDFNPGDKIISGDGSTQKIKSVSKMLREVITIKTKSGKIECSEEHRFYCYSIKTKKFDFVQAKEIALNHKEYKIVKSKINSRTEGLKILKIENSTIYLDNQSTIEFTNNDFFMVFRNNKFFRLQYNELNNNDVLIISKGVLEWK